MVKISGNFSWSHWWLKVRYVPLGVLRRGGVRGEGGVSPPIGGGSTAAGQVKIKALRSAEMSVVKPTGKTEEITLGSTGHHRASKAPRRREMVILGGLIARGEVMVRRDTRGRQLEVRQRASWALRRMTKVHRCRVRRRVI